MQKTSPSCALPSKTEPLEQNVRKFTTTPPARNQDKMPFLYLTMREPPADYKNVPDNAKKLYRVIKLNNQS